MEGVIKNGLIRSTETLEPEALVVNGWVSPTSDHKTKGSYAIQFTHPVHYITPPPPM